MAPKLLWVLMTVMFNPKSKDYETVSVHTFDQQNECLDAVRGLNYLRSNEQVSKYYYDSDQAPVVANAFCLPLGKPELIRDWTEAGR